VLRTLFAKPLAAAVFLTLNGVILLAGERLRRRIAPVPAPVPEGPGAARARILSSRRLDTLAFGGALLIGACQVLAFFAGISRSGVTMVAGLARGLSHEDAARFAFLLATRSSSPRGCTSCPTSWAPTATACVARSWRAARSPGSPPGCRCAF